MFFIYLLLVYTGLLKIGFLKKLSWTFHISTNLLNWFNLRYLYHSVIHSKFQSILILFIMHCYDIANKIHPCIKELEMLLHFSVNLHLVDWPGILMHACTWKSGLGYCHKIKVSFINRAKMSGNRYTGTN